MAALPIPSYPGISHCHHHHHPSRTERAGETCVLGDLDEGVGHLGGVGALGLGTDGGNLGAGSLKHGGCALHGVEGSGVAGGSCLGVEERDLVSGMKLLASSIGSSQCSPWGELGELTRVGAGEVLELSWTSDLGGALSGHRGHLGHGHAQRGRHGGGGDGNGSCHGMEEMEVDGEGGCR